MTTISFSKLTTFIKYPILERIPILLRGERGIGKSEFVYSIAEEAGEWLGLSNKKMSVVERRLSQMPDAGDLIGMPYRENNITQFSKTNYIHQVCNEPCIFFLDEIDRASQDVGQAAFELTDSRKIYGHILHPDTLIFLACNSGPHNKHNSYQVREFDAAELDRYAVFDIEPSVEDWIMWAKRKSILPQVIDFISQYPKMLLYTGQIKTGVVYPSPRSWVRLSRVLSRMEFQDLDAVYYLACSIVGDENGSAFRGFWHDYKNQASPDDVFAGKTYKLKTLSNHQHLDLIERIKTDPRLKKELSVVELENFWCYMNLLQPELAKTLLSVLSNTQGGVSSKNLTTLHSLIIDNVVVKFWMAELYGHKAPEPIMKVISAS